eukprot:scaffold23031_cov61-Skeletonema_dohrnii-CCMP3373.AAC.1
MTVTIASTTAMDKVNDIFQFDCDIFTSNDLTTASILARRALDARNVVGMAKLFDSPPRGNTATTAMVITTIGQMEKWSSALHTMSKCRINGHGWNTPQF